MTQLEDRRPVAAETSPHRTGPWLGATLSRLFVDHPDLDLASVRLIPNEDGTVGIAGRIGAPPTIECPQCHQPIGREHTDYCTLAPGKVWDGVLPVPTTLHNGRIIIDFEALDQAKRECAYPARNNGDGRGCQMDDCPKHGR